MASVNIRQPRGLDCSPAEWDTRVELAALYRIFVHYGWTDYVYTHLTARVPDEEGTYLINPFGLLFPEICASNLIKVDFEGNLISGDYPINNAGHLIHTAVLKARDEINFVLHSHTRAGTAVSAMKRGLLPLSQHSNLILGELTYHQYGLVTKEEDECDLIARDLGDKMLMIMQNHGLLACGRTAREAFNLHYYLDMACKIQVDVLASGEEVVQPPQESVDALSNIYSSWREVESLGDEGGWSALLRMLDARQPDFRT